MAQFIAHGSTGSALVVVEERLAEATHFMVVMEQRKQELGITYNL